MHATPLLLASHVAIVTVHASFWLVLVFLWSSKEESEHLTFLNFKGIKIIFLVWIAAFK
jgi:hypothetical protein